MREVFFMKKRRWIIPILVIILITVSVSAVFADETYIVQPNEGLTSIARKLGVDWMALAAANGIEEPWVIQPGQVLIIPAGGVTPPAETDAPAPAEPEPAAPAPAVAAPVEAAQPQPADSPGTYTVQPGDSLSKIAAQFGTNYLVLADLNDLEDPYIVNLGQVLVVPGGSGAPAAPLAEEQAQTALPAASAAPPPLPVAAPSYGGSFEIGGQTQSFANRQLMKDVGMNWVKFQHKWSPGDGPEAVAGRIADAHNSGFKVLLSIPGANTYPGPGGINFDAYVEFLRGVAALGPDAIEVWNEENIDFEWPAGEIDPASYVNNMLAPAYNAIKSANPNVMVIGGALAPTGFDNGTNAWSDSRYLAGMAAAGAARYMDCIGVHHNAGATSPYATSGHPGGGHYSWYFKPTMDLYYNTFGGAVKVCFTELGYVSPDGFPGISPQFGWAADNTVDEHAQWLAEAVDIAASSGKTRLLIIFNVDFTGYDPNGDPQAGYAMVRPGGGCPACDALRR
jgi:LysM repeat protein